MKITLTKQEAQKRIESFFQRESFTPEEAKKIKKLAMKFNIKLGKHRRNFCKKCYSKLKGKIKIIKEYKTIKCGSCGQINKFKL